MTDTPKYVSLDGVIVPWAEGNVHITSSAFKYGCAVFEGLRGYWNAGDQQLYVFRADDHARRLVNAQRFQRFDTLFDATSQTTAMVDLLRALDLREDVQILVHAYVSGGGLPASTGPNGLAIAATPWTTPARLEGGVSTQVSSWRRTPETAAPMRIKTTGNYNNGRIAAVQALADGYDTALLLNERGKVSEGPSMCFAMIRGGRAIFPSVTNDILESITRATLIDLLREDLDVTVEERDVDRSEIFGAEEAFFCGTAWEVTPITSIDRLAIGDGQPGPLTRRLQRHYEAVCRGTVAARDNWRLPIYG